MKWNTHNITPMLSTYMQRNVTCEQILHSRSALSKLIDPNYTKNYLFADKTRLTTIMI